MRRRRAKRVTLTRYEYDRDDPSSYENRDHFANQFKAHATCWVVHLHTQDEFTTVHHLTTLAEHAHPSVPLTGHYLTTSWEVWGDEPSDDGDWSLVLYFTTEKPGDVLTAYQRGKHLASLVGLGDDATFVVSTAGDWAEQVKPTEGDDLLAVAHAVGVVSE